jgi:hypothetical protein
MIFILILDVYDGKFLYFRSLKYFHPTPGKKITT